MHRKLSVAATGILAASLSGCQLVEALLPSGASGLPMEGICASYQVGGTDTPPTAEILEQTRSIIADRVSATGVAEPVVVTQGQDRISVELPGVEDEADISSLRDLLGATGVLAFMPVPTQLQGSVTEGPLPNAMTDVAPLFTGVEIASATVGQGQTSGEMVVNLELTDTAARLFDEYAAEHLGEQFAIVLDDDLVSAPFIGATRFGGRVQIAGDFTPQEADALATVQRFGPLPLEIHEIAFGACQPSGPSASATMTQDED